MTSYKGSVSFLGRLEFDVKYHILHDFRTSTPFKEISSHYFKDLRKLKLLKNSDLVSYEEL